LVFTTLSYGLVKLDLSWADAAIYRDNGIGGGGGESREQVRYRYLSMFSPPIRNFAL